MRTGCLYWPSNRSRIKVWRSALSASVLRASSGHSQELHPHTCLPTWRFHYEA